MLRATSGNMKIYELVLVHEQQVHDRGSPTILTLTCDCFSSRLIFNISHKKRNRGVGYNYGEKKSYPHRLEWFPPYSSLSLCFFTSILCF